MNENNMKKMMQYNLTRMTKETIKTLKEKEENLVEESKNKDNEIMNEIIEILIKNNLSFSESTKILDNVRRRIGIQTITTKCLYK